MQTVGRVEPYNGGMAPADTYSRELAEEVARVLDEQKERGVSMHVAARMSGLTYSMVQQMKLGRVPGPEFVWRFARRFGEDVERWLRMTGYDDLADDLGRRPEGPVIAPGATETGGANGTAHPAAPPPDPLSEEARYIADAVRGLAAGNEEHLLPEDWQEAAEIAAAVIARRIAARKRGEPRSGP